MHKLWKGLKHWGGFLVFSVHHLTTCQNCSRIMRAYMFGALALFLAVGTMLEGITIGLGGGYTRDLLDHHILMITLAAWIAIARDLGIKEHQQYQINKQLHKALGAKLREDLQAVFGGLRPPAPIESDDPIARVIAESNAIYKKGKGGPVS